MQTYMAKNYSFKKDFLNIIDNKWKSVEIRLTLYFFSQFSFI